jgi:hypothetical protein
MYSLFFLVNSINWFLWDCRVQEAYNLPLMINPTFIADGGVQDGLHCGTPSCTIPDLNSFCQAPNYLTGGPGNGCKNADGPGNTATDGTRAFKNACPSSYSFSQDDRNANPGVVYGCNLGSNYEVVFCPWMQTSPTMSSQYGFSTNITIVNSQLFFV